MNTNSVYWHWLRTGPYNPPKRDWDFDEHLNNVNHQPPGAPQNNVRAVRTWRRD